MSQKQSPDDLARALKEAVTVNEDNNSLPSLPVLYQELYGRWGGVKEFAGDIYDAFKEAKPGSQIRARIGADLMDGIKVLQDRGMLGDAGDVEALSDEDVDEEINRLIQKAAKQLVGT